MGFEAGDMAARLRAEFPGALRGGQVVGYFQPEVELSTGRLVAAELLARWEHPELGVLQPAMFLPVAEELGLMEELSRVMLRQALARHRAWAAAGWVVPVSVNIGPACVASPAFPATVARLLREEQVPGQMLALEVSEETGTTAASTTFFAQLAESGVRVSLDDFGTGFASLESLGGWPIDELKLDRSIIRPVVASASFRAIVATTIDLAHQLGIRVVAEGIETDAVSSELKALHCDIGQGFLTGRPMAAAAFTEWMRDRARLAPRLEDSGYQQASLAGEAGLRGLAGGPAGRAARAVRRAVQPVGGGALAAMLAMMIAYGSWQAFRWGGREHQALIGDAAFFPVTGAAVMLAWRASRRADLGPNACRAWRLLAVALILYMLGVLIELVYEVVLHRRPDPTWADAAYLSFYVVAVAGLMTFPSRRRNRSERLRLVLDMGTVFVGGVTLIWYIVLGPAIRGAGFDLPDLVTFAYPVGDVLLLFGALSLLWRGAPRGTVVPLRIFATGLLMFIAADITYSWITVHSTYLGGDPVDTLWFVALLILLVATSAQLRARPGGEAAPRPFAPSARPSVLPYVAVAVSYLLLVLVGLRHVAFNPLGGVLVGAVALTLLVCARQFAALQDNGRLAVRYAELASIDGMTGLYNRRHFMELAEGAFAHAQRVGQPLVALMIDVDHFKQINDVHGHGVGDRVLTDLGRSCREHVRANDIAGRYGGDEFIIIIPGTTGARAGQLAAGLTGPPARVTGADGSPVTFTLSVGVAESAGCRDLPSLLARADLAMYEAKRAGGGCFRVFQADAALPAG
jgi:diguanylate cyclase (GGDEF)-like protein